MQARPIRVGIVGAGLIGRVHAAAVREDREPAVTGEEGRKTVEIIEAMYRSGRTRAPVTFPVPIDGGAAG